MTIIPTKAMQLIERARPMATPRSSAARANEVLAQSARHDLFAAGRGRFPKWRDVLRNGPRLKIELTVGRSIRPAPPRS